ncbi:MAG: sigma-70 family RNA polymerase sigma factor [Muribaculum sp.]|nr:sigma-70 family RNA polymerase sigma factor [Muribaculum sp.]
MGIDQYTDQQIVKAILNRDTYVTKEFLYRKCYPLFKAIHNKYYTDCNTPVELINEIYLYILWPKKDTNQSKLQNFGFRCSLTLWLKIVSEHYCQQLFKKRLHVNGGEDVSDDRNAIGDDSFIENTRTLDMEDVNKVLSNMPNQRYSQLIKLRYVEEKTNEETALTMGLSMPNYYNTHKRAKEQYVETLRKEGLL